MRKTLAGLALSALLALTATAATSASSKLALDEVAPGQQLTLSGTYNLDPDTILLTDQPGFDPCAAGQPEGIVAQYKLLTRDAAGNVTQGILGSSDHWSKCTVLAHTTSIDAQGNRTDAWQMQYDYPLSATYTVPAGPPGAALDVCLYAFNQSNTTNDPFQDAPNHWCINYRRLVLASPPPPVGRPATITQTADAGGGKIAVSWTLPSASQSVYIGVASNATTVDQQFLPQYVVVSQNVSGAQTSYTTKALPAGTYFVHVQTNDPVCSCRVWSSVASVTIGAPAASPPPTTTTATTTTVSTPKPPPPTTTVTLPAPTSNAPQANGNAAPRIETISLHLSTDGRRLAMSMRVCDDGRGPLLHWRLSQTLTRNGVVLARGVKQPTTVDPKGCRTFTYGWAAQSKFLRIGKYQVGIRVTDSGKRTSNLATRGFTIEGGTRG
jgi:hypothetical protein